MCGWVPSQASSIIHVVSTDFRQGHSPAGSDGLARPIDGAGGTPGVECSSDVGCGVGWGAERCGEDEIDAAFRRISYFAAMSPPTARPLFLPLAYLYTCCVERHNTTTSDAVRDPEPGCLRVPQPTPNNGVL
jgi:hypothetical protein